MSGALTQAGAKFYIAVDVGGDAVVQNSDLDLTAYEALEWLEVKGVGNLGETGTTTNMVSYDEHATEVSQRAKALAMPATLMLNAGASVMTPAKSRCVPRL